MTTRAGESPRSSIRTSPNSRFRLWAWLFAPSVHHPTFVLPRMARQSTVLFLAVSPMMKKHRILRSFCPEWVDYRHLSTCDALIGPPKHDAIEFKSSKAYKTLETKAAILHLGLRLVLRVLSSRPPLLSFRFQHVRCHTPLPGAPRYRGFRHPHLQGALRPAYCTSRRWPYPPVSAEAARLVRASDPKQGRQRKRLAPRLQRKLVRRGVVPEYSMRSDMPR